MTIVQKPYKTHLMFKLFDLCCVTYFNVKFCALIVIENSFFFSLWAPAADSALVHGTEAALFSVLNFQSELMRLNVEILSKITQISLG